MSDSQQERNNMASGHDDPLSLDSSPCLTMFDGNRFLRVGDNRWPLPIPHNGADPPTPSTTTAQTEAPFAAKPRPPAIDFKILDHEKRFKTVGSPHIRRAAAKRRMRNGIYQCPFRDAGTGCTATFTARHNLLYHTNAHLGLKPYECSKCPYAAASPATMKRHQATCKGIAKERNDVVPKQDYPPSQELADIKLTDHFNFPFGENEISHPGDGQDLWHFHIPANGATDLPKLSPITTTWLPQSSIGPSPGRPSVINFEAVDDAILAAELSWIRDGRQTVEKERAASG